MNLLEEKRILDSIFEYKIIDIPKETRFWMVRTKQGFFYNDFIKNNYIALGWNTIRKSTNLKEENIDRIKDSIITDYEVKNPMSVVNKCKSFIWEMNEGDIIIIPSAKTKEVTFALAGEYYEEEDKNYDDEKDIISKIESNELQIKEIECPYRKRRKIKILKTVVSEKINFHLYRGISTYHGISNFDNYSKFILDSIYDIYTFGDICSLQIGINTVNPIKARDISKLMLGISNYMSHFISDDNLSVTLNLNSPGRISLTPRDVYNFIKNNKSSFIIILLLLTGGKACGFELPGIVSLLKDIKTMNIEVEKSKEELEQIKLDNFEKKCKIKMMLEEHDVNIDELSDDITMILSTSENLELGLDDGIKSEKDVNTEEESLENKNNG
ncbi:hypothetical protein [Clostridium butyricum]|uniref:hypothetical protein n=1 Tax=Clostridium butyricum TaxID=1492 RepID=UPI0034657286